MAEQSGRVKVVLGAASVGDSSIDPTAKYDTSLKVKAFLDAFYAHGGRTIDTARGYSPHAPGTSEPRLGAVNAGSRFTIDTKVVSQKPGAHNKAGIESSINDSLAALKVDQIDIEYLHVPDRATPFEETVEAINEGFKAGKFKRFGLSNYSPEEVEAIVKISEKNGWVKPSVYQGQYNAFVRGGEGALFPILRKYGIAFYAYSPAAGGFFSKKKDVTPAAGSRFDKNLFLGQMYSSLYVKGPLEAAAAKVVDVAAKHNITGHGAALRWAIYHSKLDARYGDAVVIGASSIPQLETNFEFIEAGPLPEEVREAVEAVWDEVKADAPPFHF